MRGSSQPLGNHPLLHLLTLPWSCPATSGCVCWLIDWGLSFTWIWLVILDPIDFNWFTLYPCRRRQWHPTPVLLPGKIPWMEEPGGLQSMGLLRIGHNWATSLSLFTFMHWRRKWQSTPMFLPGESQGWGAWWAAVYGVAQSRTWLKRLSSSSMGIGGNGALAHVKRKEQVVRFIIFICLFPWGCFLVSCKQR